MTASFNQYSTAEPLMKGFDSWIGDPLEQRRIASYELYEMIYWNMPQTFTLTQRGTEENPIYMPSGRIIVDTMHRYLAPGLKIIPDATIPAAQNEITAVMLTLTQLFRRERFMSRFSANKREGLFRGDWLWHLFADPNKPEGSRISIQPLDPGSYFPIYADDDLDTIIGCHIVTQFTDSQGKPFINRLTYMKETELGGPSPILASEGIYKTDDWGGPGMDKEVTPEQVVRPDWRLPDPVDQLPTYHIQNFQQSGSPYGSSELRGMERLIAAIDQTISDEELALALDGLGVYATNAGTPQNDAGEDTSWDIGPGRVVELPGGKETFFSRVSGIATVDPNIAHMSFILSQMYESLGISDVARGAAVDVQVAESGVARYLKLAPLLARAEEKDLIVTDVMSNLLFDLRKWHLAYEGTAQRAGMENVITMPVYGEKIPPNNKEKFEQVIKMVEDGVVSGMWAREELAKMGYVFPDDATMMSQILTEKTATAQVQADAMGARLDQELQQQQQDLSGAGSNGSGGA